MFLCVYTGKKEDDKLQDQLRLLREKMANPSTNVTEAEIAVLESGQDVPESPIEMDGLLQSIFDLGLFDAIIPAPTDGERIYEYDERRREFNFILHDFIAEKMKPLIDRHKEEVDELENDFKVTESKWTDEFAAINTILESTEKELEQRERELKAKSNELDNLTETFDKLVLEHASLKTEFEQSKVIKPLETSSAPIKDRIAKLGERSADELYERFMARQNAKDPNYVAPVTQFREDTLVNLGNDPVLPSVEIPQVGLTFPESEPAVVPSDSESGEVVPKAVRDYVAAEIKALAARNNLV